MEWTLKYQNQIEWFEKLEAEGHDVSDVMDSRPELYEDLAPYWNAFHHLSGSRQSGFGIGPIPIMAYESYFRIFGITSLDERVTYLKFVGALDTVFLDHAAKKSEAKGNAKGKGVPPARPSKSRKK